jgi:hypothetical protein
MKLSESESKEELLYGGSGLVRPVQLKLGEEFSAVAGGYYLETGAAKGFSETVKAAEEKPAAQVGPRVHADFGGSYLNGKISMVAFYQIDSSLSTWKSGVKVSARSRSYGRDIEIRISI